MKPWEENDLRSADSYFFYPQRALNRERPDVKYPYYPLIGRGGLEGSSRESVFYASKRHLVLSKATARNKSALLWR
jgi:hypothetical protein